MFVSQLHLGDLQDGIEGEMLIIPYYEAFKKTNYTTVIERIIELNKKFSIQKLISEMNGIGDMPTQTLERGGVAVEGLFTNSQNKINGYGKMKILMQAGKLLIPREPELIKQLTNLRYTLSESGASMSIAHSRQYPKDDYCDALMFALLACDSYDVNNQPDMNLEFIKSKLKEKGIKIRKGRPMIMWVGGSIYDHRRDDFFRLDKSISLDDIY